MFPPLYLHYQTLTVSMWTSGNVAREFKEVLIVISNISASPGAPYNSSLKKITMQRSHIPISALFTKVLVRTDRCHVLLDALDIIALRVFNKYVYIYLKARTKPLMVAGSLGAMEKQLFPLYFGRTHGSWIVGLHHLISVNEDSVLLSEEIEAPLSRQYRKDFLDCYRVLN